MGLIKKIVVACIMIGSSICYASDKFTPEKVVNGRIVNSKNSAYVQIFEYNIDNSGRYRTDTGTMLSNKHVIMPAHLVKYPDKAEQYYVLVNGKRFLVKSINIPDSFDSTQVCTPSNIAILTLKKAVPKKVKTLPITTKLEDFGIDTKVTYYGYGCDVKGLDCAGKDAYSLECRQCWGKLRKGSSKITAIYDDYVLLEENKDTNGFVNSDGGPAATVSVKREVIKKVKTKKGKIKKVKKVVTQDAILGLSSCYRWYTENSQAVEDSKQLIPLMQSEEVVNFIKKATSRKAKFL